MEKQGKPEGIVSLQQVAWWGQPEENKQRWWRRWQKPYSFCMLIFFLKKLRLDFVQVDEDDKAVLLDLGDQRTGGKGKGSLKKSSQGKEWKKGRKWWLLSSVSHGN